MSAMYSDDRDRGNINPYTNQSSIAEPVLQFTSPAQWKSFTGEKQGHMTSLHNSHGLITSASMVAPSAHNSHVLMTSPSLVSQNNHSIITSPSMVSNNNHTLMTSSAVVPHNEMLINAEQKSVHPYAAYYPPWPGHIHIPPVVGHGSFGQMLGSIEPSRVSVPISTHLNRQEIIPVLANSANSMSTVNMVGHLNHNDSVAVVAHANRQDGVGVSELPAMSPMTVSISKEYWPSVVSGIHTPNISMTNGCVVPLGNSSNCCVAIGQSSNSCVVPVGQSSNNCVMSAGHSSNSDLVSITSCSYVKAGSVMSQIVNEKSNMTLTGSSTPVTSSVYQTQPVATANCVKTINEGGSYSIPAVSSLSQVSQHQCYPKSVTSMSMTEHVVQTAQEDIVARALSQSLSGESDSVTKLSSVLHCVEGGMRENFSVQKTSQYASDMQESSNVEKTVGTGQTMSQSFMPVDKPAPFSSALQDSSGVGSLPPYDLSVRESFTTADKPVRRGPGRPPGSASAGDDPQEKPYQCEYCERRFKHSQQRRVHVMSHTGERPHTCPYCQKGFKTLAQKTDHIRVHTGDKPYKCTICWREFGKYATMKKHLNTHLDTPPYQCTHCQKGFYLADRLKVHTREHTDERPFQCDQCERAFKNTNHLKFHKMVHSGEVPFRCEICWKGFQDKVKFDRHQICHQNDNLLRCANCQIGFARVEEMTEHFEVCRANENNTTPSGWVSF